MQSSKDEALSNIIIWPRERKCMGTNVPVTVHNRR